MRAVLGVALVGLVVFVGCGPPKPTQEEAIAAIKALGGKFEVDENNDVVYLDLKYTKVADAGLVHLEGLPRLTTLNLIGTKVTDVGLEHLVGLAKLESLNLTYAKVTDAGLVHLKGLTNLEQLHLLGTKVTAGGVKKLQQALPNCDISH